MANNELSGPVVATFISKWIQSLKSRNYTYRIVFVPETIGSIAYLSQHLDHLKKYVKAGFNVTCIGDDRSYSFLPSRNGNTLSDTVGRHVIKWIDKNFIEYQWSDRGSDERQYCAPKVDLPIASLMRTKYGKYPEYHTSLDDLEKVVTPSGLEGGYMMMMRVIQTLEHNSYPLVNVIAEPQLGKRGLYPERGVSSVDKNTKLIMDLLTWSDGENSLVEIANKCEVPIWDLYPILKDLQKHNLIKISDEK